MPQCCWLAKFIASIFSNINNFDKRVFSIMTEKYDRGMTINLVGSVAKINWKNY
ncbi:hypothetical protein H1P_6300002 [Hyella patelloides LEGE 07179]|uniref:Uncharacterized protein n=1 Tax=Hyella patelloides LEGE 07179 TaxID=945734 RepID=A0A563W1Q9_9CYAN|nr:hypothetical protein H1P_6300002 [Hyella patelloides LEGE 07179]